MSTATCPHFGVCGGCDHQGMPDEDYRELKRRIVLDALARQGFEDVPVEPAVEIPPATRRRAVFKAAKEGGVTSLGFHAARSHFLVDVHVCLVLTPRLAELIHGLRAMMGAVLRDNESADLHVTEADNGVDVALRWRRKPTPATIAALAPWAERLKLARITMGGEIAAERILPILKVGGVTVNLPPEAFLQPTRLGEDALQRRVAEIVAGAKSVADLFAGLGTFSLPLARQVRVHAVEIEKPMLDALSAGARMTPGLKPVTVEKRDLFKRPLSADELARFDAVVLDPPRAGAEAQMRALAAAKTPRIAYVSCDPDSFARDARILARYGYRLAFVLPVDQFLWSSHIELVAAFDRS